MLNVVLDPRTKAQIDPARRARALPGGARTVKSEVDEPTPCEHERCIHKHIAHPPRHILGRLKARAVRHHRDGEQMQRSTAALVRAVEHIFRPEAT